MRAKVYFWLMAAVCLCAGCQRNAIWSKPDSYSIPLALASFSVISNEFSLRCARYGVYLFHHAPCSVITQHTNDPTDYPRAIRCDVDVTIRRGDIGDPLLHRRTTNAVLMMFGATNAFYDLGYFESGMRGKLKIVISNTPSLHDDSVCHAQVDVIEVLPK